MTLLEQSKTREEILKKYKELKEKNIPMQEIIKQLKNDYGSCFDGKESSLMDFLVYNKINEKKKKIDKNSLKNKAKEILNFSKNPLKNKDEITKLCNEIKLSDADKSVKKITDKISKSVEKKVASIFTKNINENILNRFYSRIIKEDGEENNEIQQLAQDLLNKVDEIYFSGETFVIGINKVIQILKVIDSFGDKIQEINKNRIRKKYS